MSKIKRLKKRFTAFVNQLTPDQVREQLVLAYLQMEKCQAVLKGYDVEPVEMMNNGESSDLELFYRCKKAAEELAYLNKMVHDGKKVGTLELEVKVDTRNLQNELDKIKIRDYIKPIDFHLEPFLRFKEELSRISESLRMPKFGKGQEVWYMFGDRVQHSTIVGIVRKVDGVTIYKTKLGHKTAECETFCSLEELMENLKKTVNE
jgi:dGTP triphosphohydrolase